MAAPSRRVKSRSSSARKRVWSSKVLRKAPKLRSSIPIAKPVCPASPPLRPLWAEAVDDQNVDDQNLDDEINDQGQSMSVNSIAIVSRPRPALTRLQQSQP